MSPEDERHIGFLISDVARLMRTAFDRRVRALGLTRSQWLVINRLHRRPGATQSELAEMLEVEKATAGRMVDRMEKKGWVVRRADAGDRRVNRLHLTQEATADPGSAGADRRPHRRRCAGAAVRRASAISSRSGCGGSKRSCRRCSNPIRPSRSRPPGSSPGSWSRDAPASEDRAPGAARAGAVRLSC